MIFRHFFNTRSMVIPKPGSRHYGKWVTALLGARDSAQNLGCMGRDTRGCMGQGTRGCIGRDTHGCMALSSAEVLYNIYSL